MAFFKTCFKKRVAQSCMQECRRKYKDKLHTVKEMQHEIVYFRLCPGNVWLGSIGLKFNLELKTKRILKSEPKIKWWKSRKEQNTTSKHEVSPTLAEKGEVG